MEGGVDGGDEGGLGWEGVVRAVEEGEGVDLWGGRGLC